ncbi:MAG: prepilin-type N-terminal cleavage/methylation domain-containing protein [Planctomycetes bacterium]|nr:prepilin-type N-terminal cleavage/methylation domain-containing protein [Planctomycetota bacterium]
MTASERRQAGFTLLELIVVVFIITLITGLAATRLDFLVPKYRLRAAVRETAAILRQARSRAVSIGRDVYVRIRLSDGRYEMLVPFEREPERSSSSTDPYEDPPLKEYEFQEVFKKSLPDKTEFVNVILGAEEGEIKDTGTVLLRMSSYGLSDYFIINFRLEKRRMALRFNGLTGSVSFYEEEKGVDEILEDQGT